jgi:hypothetical protein
MPETDVLNDDFWCFPMEPSKQSSGGKDLFRERLDAIIDLKHLIFPRKSGHRVMWREALPFRV